MGKHKHIVERAQAEQLDESSSIAVEAWKNMAFLWCYYLSGKASRKSCCVLRGREELTETRAYI